MKIVVCRKSFIVVVMVAILTMTLFMANGTVLASASVDALISGEVKGSIQMANDEPFPNAAVHLVSQDSRTTCITRTDSNGMYQFVDLPLGAYTLTVDQTTLRGGWAISYDSGVDIVYDGYTFTLTDAEPTIEIEDFWVVYPTSRMSTRHSESSVTTNGCVTRMPAIGGFIGSIDSPNAVLPLPSVTVSLFDTSDNTVVAETMTDASGAYLFTDLELGDYTIIVDDSTLPTEGNFASPAYSPDGDGDHTTRMTLTESVMEFRSQDFVYEPTWDSAGGTSHTELFGVIEGSIGNVPYVYIPQPTTVTLPPSTVTLPPAPLPDATVRLLDSDGRVVAETTTDAIGNYRFSEVPLGVYTIDVDRYTFPDIYDYIVISSPDNGTDGRSTVVLRANDSVKESQDFVYEYYVDTAITMSNHIVTEPPQLVLFVIVALAVLTVSSYALNVVERE